MKENKLRISFCTVSMNRLEHIQKTLPKNIEDNISYGNVEFVLLNYNSSDSLNNWIHSEMLEYIKIGVLKYIWTTEPEYFQMSHSKNVVAKYATGHIICNVDADNFIGEGFADYIVSNFEKNKNIFMSVDKRNTEHDCFGRICITRKDFMNLRGYDESMNSYGFEDFDFINRLKRIGVKQKFITDKKYLKALNHDDNIRLKNHYYYKEIKDIYLRHEKPSISEVIYVMADNKVYRGHIIENNSINSESIENMFSREGKEEFEFQYSLLNNKWETGVFSNGDINIENIQIPKINENIDYHKVVDPYFISSLVMNYSLISNGIKMKMNSIKNRVVVNKESFGEVKIKILLDKSISNVN